MSGAAQLSNRSVAGPRRAHFRGQRALIALLLVACDPLDIQLFPVRVDAGAEQEQPEQEDADAVVPMPEAPPEAGAPARCFPGAQRCEECVANAACGADERCHPLTGECMTACGPGLPDCDAPGVCSEDLGGICVSCVDPSTCTDDDRRVCDELQGVCVECTDDSDCTDDPLEHPVCLPGLNICGCQSDDECESGICELPEAHCEEVEADDN